MMPSAFNSVRPGSRPKYGQTDLTPEILVFFSWKKCGCGRTARVTTGSNSDGCARPNLLDSWTQVTHYCELLFLSLPSLESDFFSRVSKNKSLPELLLRESQAKSTLYPMKGNVSYVLQ
jgi:hypothetical protein